MVAVTPSGDGAVAWNANTAAQAATNLSVQGNDTLYLSASEQSKWLNNRVVTGTTTAFADGQDSLKMGVPSYKPHPTTHIDSLDPNGFIQSIAKQAGLAGQLMAEATQHGKNARDYAMAIARNGGSAGQKEMAAAFLGYSSLQDELSQAGLYTTAPVLGAWRPQDETALHNALSSYFQIQGTGAQSSPTSFNEWLQGQAAAGQQNGINPANPGASGSSTGSGFKATSPADIVMQGDAESQGLLGRSMNAGEQGNLVSDVQGQQKAAFEAGDVYQRSVTPQSVARQFVLENNLPEYTQHQAEGYMNAFANMFLTGQNARANTSIGDAAVNNG